MLNVKLEMAKSDRRPAQGQVRRMARRARTPNWTAPRRSRRRGPSTRPTRWSVTGPGRNQELSGQQKLYNARKAESNATPIVALADQTAKASKAAEDFEKLKKLVEAGRSSALVAQRLNNSFRRLANERASISRNELAQVNGLLAKYEGELTAVELDLINDERGDRELRDNLLASLPESRGPRPCKVFAETEKAHRKVLEERQAILTALEEQTEKTRAGGLAAAPHPRRAARLRPHPPVLGARCAADRGLVGRPGPPRGAGPRPHAARHRGRALVAIATGGASRPSSWWRRSGCSCCRTASTRRGRPCRIEDLPSGPGSGPIPADARPAMA